MCGILYIAMGKTLKPNATTKVGHLAEAEAPVRAVILAELPKGDRDRILEGLVESAMMMGLIETDQVRTWLGIESIGNKSINYMIDKITEKWLEETKDVYEFASSQRVTQIKKAWKEVRNCEHLFEEAKTTSDKVKVKKLQLEWMQYISKLALVDKMVEAATPDMQIVVNGGLSIEEGRDVD